MLDLTNQLAAQLMGHHVGEQSLEKYKEKPTNIVFAKNGVFRVVVTPIAIFKTQIAETTTKQDILGVEAMEAGPQLLIPKIPFRYLQMILSWYKDINIKDHTEASVLFFWNHNNVAIPTQYADKKPINGLIVDGQLVIYCPKQRNSPGLSEFHMDTMVPWLRENLSLLCETHSHNTMNAFFSGTDDANENATQFYGVWGKVMDNEPAFAFRYVCGDQKIQITPDVLFEWPKKVVKTLEVVEVEGEEPVTVVKEEKVTLLKGPFAHVDYPEDWTPQHTKATYAAPSYGGQGRWNGAGTGAHQGRWGSTQAAANQGTSMYDYRFDEHDQFLRQQALSHAQNDSAHKETAGGKKFEIGLREVGNESLAGADVIEIHTQDDFENFQPTENEAKDIAEDLTDYGYDKVITSAIDAVNDAKAEMKKVN